MRKKKLFFFLTILIVSLLFYWLGRKQTGAEEIRIDTRERKADGGIIVEKVLAEQKETETRKIALTFDDGPHPYYTEQLLDGLKERNVCATFFVTGEHAELYPDIIERMKEEGHLIGNHTYSHMQLRYTGRSTPLTGVLPVRTGSPEKCCQRRKRMRSSSCTTATLRR